MSSALFVSRSTEIGKQILSVVYCYANDMPTEVNKAFSEKQIFFDEIRSWLSSTVGGSFLFLFRGHEALCLFLIALVKVECILLTRADYLYS